MSDDTPAMPPETAKSLVDQAMAAVASGNLDGALATFAEVEAALRFTPDPAGRVQWARCLNGLGFIDLMDAKEARRAGPADDADTGQAFVRGLRHALARFEQALAIQSDATYRASVTGNKAYALALLGETAKARPLLDALFRDLGWDAYRGQLDDARRQSVPEDAAIISLLNDVWNAVSR